MQIFSHSIFISELIKLSHIDTYLELGVYDGETFSKIVPLVKRAVGVDIVDKRFISNGIFFNMTTDKFFEQNKDTFDYIFIDACHEYNQVKKDFENSLKILKGGGRMLLHDTDPIEEKYTNSNYCGDTYKLITDIETGKYHDLQVVTLPINECGLSIVQRIGENRINDWI